MKAVELMEILAMAVEKNPNVDISLAISKKNVENLILKKIEDTEFFDINVKSVPEEDIVFLFLNI